MSKYVYLAGPIDGLTFDECRDWRCEANSRLGGSIICLDPTRRKDYMKGRTIEVKFEKFSQFPLTTKPGILARDFNDIKRSDCLLVNLLGAKKVSIGTVSEMAWAYYMRIPMVVVMEEKDNPHDHGWIEIFSSGFMVNNLDDAYRLVTDIICP